MSAYWKTLTHHGVYFPEPYKPDGLSVRVKGRRVALSPLAEEMAYMLAKKKDTPYIQDPVFTANFMADFLKQLPDWCQGSRFSDVDFGELFAKVDTEKAAKESMSKEEKKAAASERKERREELKAHYGKATLDGQELEIANWLVEPPGLFMGRGAHPMRGKWKPRVTESDVILNLGRSATVPPGKWKKVVHDHNSMWMAKWIDKLTRKEKYVWLHESSHIQQTRNRAKYDKAEKVGRNLQKIRARILKGLDSKNPRTRQVATACYLIDMLGMRVGDEKDEDEADTVGASTLRVEHLKFQKDKIVFDFLGKDSVAPEAELYYRVRGKLHYGTIEELSRSVIAKKQWTDSSGRTIIVPDQRVEVLTMDNLVQKRAQAVWTEVHEIIIHEVSKPLYSILTVGGKAVRVTGDHSLFYELNQYRAIGGEVKKFTADTSLATVTSLPIQTGELSEFDGIPIDDGFLTFLGLWYADGCYYPKGVIISAGKDESIQNFLSRFAISYRNSIEHELERVVTGGKLGYDNYTRGRLGTVLREVRRSQSAFGLSRKENGDIWCHSITLKRMMESLGVAGDSHTKVIPEWIMCLSDRQIGCFLRGYFSGDGFVSSARGEPISSSVSPVLSGQVRTLLLRLGIDSTMTRSKGGGFDPESVSHIVRIGRWLERGFFQRRIGFIQRPKNALLMGRMPNPRYDTYGIRWRKIRIIVKQSYSGKVYDLSTENERFIVNHLLVHNSVRWEKTLDLGDGGLKVMRNLRDFSMKKSPDSELFHHIDSAMVNQFLSSIVPGLTAKVFRTYHATAIEDEALKSKDVRGADDLDKLYHAKEANLKAAIFCNHIRTPPKTWEESLKKKEQKLADARSRQKPNANRVKKLEMELDFYRRTKNYNLNTSLKNYIDPRVVKAWSDSVGLDWAKIYSKSLQRKFSWVNGSSAASERGRPLKVLASSTMVAKRAP